MRWVGYAMIAVPFVLWTVYGIKQIGWRFVTYSYIAVMLLMVWIGVASYLARG